MVSKLEVGKPYKEGVTRYNQGIKFDFTQAGGNLYLFLNKPAMSEIESIKNGKLQVGFCTRGEAIFMLFKFKGMEWMDAPYTVHLSKKLESLEQLDIGMGYSLMIHLVDASNGILKVLRLVGMSTSFSSKLRKALMQQQQMSFNNARYDACIGDVYGRYTTDHLVQLADATCSIG